MKTVRRIVAIAALSAVTTVGGVTVAMAGGSDDPAGNSEWAERADRICERAPNVQDRVGNLLERIHGGDDVRGSIAWLTARAEQAREEGHENVANFLEHRATIRAERVDVLIARQDALGDAAAWCSERGDDT
ncbi:MAG: hypothetical protein ACRDWI_20470 [Jiangellaceae bacterium]